MIKSVQNDDCMYFEVIDKCTGKVIPHVTWANDETGEYDQFEANEKMSYMYCCK